MISKTIIYDVDGPTISIDSMLPTAEKYDAEKEDGIPESGSYLNGDVKMKIAILDDYDSVNTEIKDPEDDRRPQFIITDKDDNPIAFRVENETEKFPVSSKLSALSSALLAPTAFVSGAARAVVNAESTITRLNARLRTLDVPLLFISIILHFFGFAVYKQHHRICWQ